MVGFPRRRPAAIGLPTSNALAGASARVPVVCALFRAQLDTYMLGGPRRACKSRMAAAAAINRVDRWRWRQYPAKTARPARGSRRGPSGPAPARASGNSPARRAIRGACGGSRCSLPIAAALMAAGFFGYSYVSSPLPFEIDFSGAAVSDGKLVMTEPKLDGFTKDNLPYSMRAARALAEPRLHRAHRAAGDEGPAARRRHEFRHRGRAQGASTIATRTRWRSPAPSPSPPPMAWRPA